MAIDDRVQRFYQCYDESQRLADAGRGELVRLRTWELFRRFLPLGAAVADVGGGPGVHAAHLVAEGHAVTLVDPVPDHARQAAAAGVRALVGDARSLPLPAASTGAVLLMGPLYHLPDPADRHRALTEAHRVLIPGGRLLAEVITRPAWLIDATARRLLDADGIWEVFEHNLVTGLSNVPDRLADGGFWAYFHQPDELVAEVLAAGFELEALVAVEGFAALLDDLPGRLAHPGPLLRAVRLTEAEPSLLGVSPHLLAVAHRP